MLFSLRCFLLNQAFYYTSHNLPLCSVYNYPKALANVSCRLATAFSISSSDISSLCLSLHVFRIRCCSGVKCFRTSLSSSQRTSTIFPSGVSGNKADRSNLNSFQSISVSINRIPYWVRKEASISSQSSSISYQLFTFFLRVSLPP